jgi:hypothetical protein
MSDLSKRTDEELERALKTLGRNLPAPQGVGLLDRVETELTGDVRHPRRGFRVEWRTLAVAAIALAVAGVGALLVLRAFGTRPNVVGTEPAGGFHALWPETTWDEAVAAQERVDAGEDGWRRAAPEETALMFVRDVLGWVDPSVSTCQVNNEAPSYLQTTCPEGPNRVRVYAVEHRGGSLNQPKWMFDLARLVRPGDRGVWSITGIWGGGDHGPWGAGVEIEVDAGTSLRLGEQVPLQLPEPRDKDYTTTGFAYLRECGIQYVYDQESPTGHLKLIPQDVGSCAGGPPEPLREPMPGVLIAVRTHEGVLPIFRDGSDLFEWFRLDEGRIAGMSMVAVELLPAPMEPSPDVTPSPPPTPHTPGEQFVFVWPEIRRKDAAATQSLVDGGEPSLQWRLDPAEVASRLVTDFMMRDVVDVQVVGTGADLAYDVVDSLGYHEIVTVAQPVRKGDGGIYSVVDVYSDRTQVDRIEVRPDGSATIEGTARDPGARIGYSLNRACPDSQEACGYDSILLTTFADANGAFHIEIARDSVERSGALAVWIVTDDAGWQDLRMRFIPPGPYSR